MRLINKCLWFSIIFVSVSLIVGFRFTDTTYPYYERGNELLKRGNYDLAIYNYSKAIEHDKGFASAYCNRGIAFMRKGAFELAFADFNRSIELEPSSEDAYFNRGGLRGKTGDFDGAVADFTKVIKMDSTDYEAFKGRALAFERKGDHDRALSDYNKALEINSGYSDGYSDRGLLWRRMGQYDRAIVDYDMAITTDKNSFKGYADKAHLLATCPDKRYRDGRLAVLLAKKALELDHSATTTGIVAAAHAENGEFDEAVRLQQEAIRLLEEEGNQKKIPEFRRQLESYQSQKPWRE